MPVSIRTLSPTISAASYRFPVDKEKVVEEDWPWLHAPSSASDLCENCSRLSFPWLFTQALSAYTVIDGALTAKLSDGICLGLYKDISRRLNCSFCQLLVHALKEGADIEMLNQYDEWPQREVWINNHFLGKDGFVVVPKADTDERIARLGVRFRSDDEDNLIVSFEGRTVMIQEIVEAPDIPARDLGRALDTNTEGLVQTIKDWLQPCLAHEAPAIAPKREDITSIRLIDTQKHCIVGPLRNERYVALSYTWGKVDPLVLLARNDAELRKKDALLVQKAHLPVTIQDAIRLCALLGERYLWVDSLCIMQDTPDKHTQIQQMDRIYQEAAFCIVAAVGMDANAGLPGVSGPRNARQRIIKVDDMRLANTISSLERSLAQTYWQRRGWCFQENLLSMRKLVFTPDQTYYHCQHGKCAEDTHNSIHVTSALATNELPWLLNLKGRSNWDIYRNVVTEYSTRELSFEADVLNAFAAISALLSALAFSSCPFVMGIPICSLEVGLMWYPLTRLQRRSVTNIPSWSWAGWIGYVGYLSTGDCEKDFDRTISQVKWHVGIQGDMVTCIPPQSWESWRDWKRVVVGELENVYYIHAESGPDRWFAHPIAQQQWPVAPYSPLLRCTAEVAELTLTSEHTDFWTMEGECEEGHEICHLKVLDQHGHLAGVVVMDGATFEQASFSQQPFAFVKISRTTLTALHDPAWDPVTKTFAGRPGEPGVNPRPAPSLIEDEFDQDVYDSNICWCMYNVLVVKFEADIANRLAVGRIYYTAFDNASPERRTFWLG